MKTVPFFIIILVLITLLNSSVLAEYNFTEVLLIPWGTAPNEIEISNPFSEDVNHTPEDSTDDSIFPGNGPDKVFVDLNENLYFSSYELGYFKAFDNSGSLLANYSRDDSLFNIEFYLNSLINFYVDSNGSIHFVGFPRMDYIAKVDCEGNLLAKLSPFELGMGHEIFDIFINSMNSYSVYTDIGFYTYVDGEFSAGGSTGWLAPDDYYYFVKGESFIELSFKKYRNPDINGIAEWKEIKLVEYDGNLTNARVLSIDDNSVIYIHVTEESGLHSKIMIYDLDYTLLDYISLEPIDNWYSLWVYPFVRSDGNIYEFLFRDDGLHVIRWSKE